MADASTVVSKIQAALAEAQSLVSQSVSAYLNLEMTDAAAIAKAASQTDINQQWHIAQPWAFNPEFLTESTGLKYVRFSSDPDTTKTVPGQRSRLIDWKFNYTPSDEVYLQYVIYIEPDVQIGMTAQGVKLPGPSNNFDGSATELVECRLWHGPSDPANPGLYQLAAHLYIAETLVGGSAKIIPFSAYLQAGRYHVIRGRFKLNTPGIADGIMEIRLDNTQVHLRNDVLYRNTASAKFDNVYTNVYHGGLINPSAVIHYRLSSMMVTDSWAPMPAYLPTYIPPPVVSGQYPSWRNNLPLGVFSSIALTSSMNNVTSDRATIYTWNGLAAGAHTWYAALNGGHGAMENKVIGIDLSANFPQWSLLHPGSPASAWGDYTGVDGTAAYFKDDLPAPRHTYFQILVIEALNRIMAFGGNAVNFLAGSTPHVDGFDLAAKKWDAPGTWQDSPITHWGVLTCAKDPRTEDVYVAGYGVHAKWTAATKTWITLVPIVSPAADWEYKGTVIDPKRNSWVWLTGSYRNCIDLTTMAYSTGRVTGALDDGSQYGIYEDYAALVYDEDNDRYLQIVNGKLFAINPDTWVSSFLMSVPVAGNGVQSRFTYFKELGGVAYLPTFESNVLFMPTR